MKKVLYFPVLLVSLLLTFGVTNTANSKSCVGGDITYTYQGPKSIPAYIQIIQGCRWNCCTSTTDICYQSANLWSKRYSNLKPHSGNRKCDPSFSLHYCFKLCCRRMDLPGNGYFANGMF